MPRATTLASRASTLTIAILMALIASSCTLSAWGAGAPTALPASLASEPGVVGPGEWIDVAAGDDQSCGIDRDRNLWCWLDESGPRQFGIEQRWLDVDAAVSYPGWCARTLDEQLWCSFDGSDLAPMQTPARVASFSMSERGPCLIDADHALVCLDVDDQIVSRDLGPFEQVAAGRSRCAIDRSSRLWCGELGTSPLEPVEGSDWWAVDVGSDAICGLRASGELWCWGANDRGQAALGPAFDAARPTRVGDEDDWHTISLGAQHGCGLRAFDTNSLWCWGANDDSQVGDGSSVDQRDPVHVGPGQHWSFVSAGTRHTLAVDL